MEALLFSYAMFGEGYIVTRKKSLNMSQKWCHCLHYRISWMDFSVSFQVIFCLKWWILYVLPRFVFMFCWNIGAARGCGWQNFCAIMNLVAYYIVGIPCALLFAFVLHVGGMVRLPVQHKIQFRKLEDFLVTMRIFYQKTHVHT